MVTELLVYIFDEIRVSNKISWRNTVLISECSDFLFVEVNAQEFHRSRETGYELIFDAEPFAQLIVILEENFYANLLLPHLGANIRLYFAYRPRPEPVGTHCIKINVREVVPACPKMDVICQLYKLLTLLISLPIYILIHFHSFWKYSSLLR